MGLEIVKVTTISWFIVHVFSKFISYHENREKNFFKLKILERNLTL